MKVRAILVTLLFLASAIIMIFDCGQVGIAQTSLLDDAPVLDISSAPHDYEIEVLPGEYAVVGVRPQISNDNNMEIYTDTTYNILIDDSNSVGDMVDFVVLDKDTYNSPPNRGVKVTGSSSDFVIEMENDMESHPVFDSWGGSMTKIPGNPIMDLGPPGSWDDVYTYFPAVINNGSGYQMWYSGYDGSNVRIGYATSPDGLTWTKYAGNPVLDLGPGAWESVHVHYPMVLYDGGIYKMWYSGMDGSRYRIGYATSPDGITWTKFAGNPVLTPGSPGAWDDTYVGQASVLIEGGIYHMWYSGLKSGGIGKIGYATSPDGITWTKYAGNPILNTGPGGSFDDTRAYNPVVAFDGLIYHMFYAGMDGSTYRIGHATSIDKISWTKNPGNPVLNLGPGGSWDDSSLGGGTLHIQGDTFLLWYHGSSGSNNRIGLARGYARLPDSGNWMKNAVNPILDIGSPTAWDDEYVGHPTLVFKDDMYHMWYTGDGGSSTFRIGYAYSIDGITWIKHPSNPVLNLGSAGTWDDARVYAPSVIFENGMYHMWYSGMDGGVHKIGYATSLDGVNWIKSPSNPVINIGSGGSWDDSRIYAPSVLYDGVTFHMWYSGFDGSNYRIGYATSPDGTTWTKYASNPVLSVGPGGSWDDNRIFAPSVILQGNDFHMWYTGYDGSKYRIGYAGSPNGFTWTKGVSNPVLDMGLSGSWDDNNIHQPTVYYSGTTYHMWYSGEDGSNTRIGHAIYGIDLERHTAYSEVLDAFEITGISSGVSYTIDLIVPITVDLDLFIYDATGGRNDAVSSSITIGAGNDESITFTAPTTGDYLLVITNENGGTGAYSISFTVNIPSISNVAALPNPQEVFGNVNISADITGGSPIYGVWVEIYDPIGGLIGNYSMINVPGFDTYYFESAYGLLGQYDFTIWANDTNDNWVSTSDTFVIQDATPPAILDVLINPDPQEIYGSVRISANITDNYLLNKSLIEIYNPFGGLIGNFSMINQSGNDLYYYDLACNLLGQYSFTIWANDTSNNLASFSDTFVIQDSTPPSIINVLADPDPQEVYGYVRVSADISDNYQLGGKWIEIYDPLENFVGNLTLLYDSIDDNYYRERTYDILGEYTFTILANDVVNNWNSASGIFTIEDTTPPVIENVITTPDPQEVFGAVDISATITDNYQLSGAWIEIYDPDGDFIDNYTMSYDSISDKYTWGDTFDLIGDYSFTIFANDTENNWASYSGEFTIQDTINPIILDDTATPNPQEVFGTVIISTNVTDNYELDDVTIEIFNPQGNLLVNFPMEQDPVDLTYYWTQSYSLLGTYSYKISANDTSNNIASVSGTFLIRDTTPPVLSNIKTEPDLPEVKDPLNILATVTDNYQLHGVWVEIYNADGVSYGNHSMDYDIINERYFYNQSYNKSGAYNFTIWSNDTSDNWAGTSGSFEVEPEPEPDEYNWKPIIALIFSIILLIVGIIVVLVRPMKFTGELSKDRWYSLLAGVVPFVVAEAITGIVSYFTGLLAIPPLLGIGMIVDLGILIVGMAICVAIYLKGVPSESYDKGIPPPPEEQNPPEMFEQDESEIPPSPSDELPPIPPPETPPPLPPPAPPPAPPLDTPPEPPSSPYEEIPPPF